MNVLHVVNNLGSGGAEKLLEELIPLMNQEQSVNADILLLTNINNVFDKSLIEKGVKVDVIKYNNLLDPRNIFAIKKHISKNKYDIVHSHTFPSQYWVALSSIFLRNNNIKFITTEHSTHNKRRDKFYFKLIEKYIYSKYDVIVSITEKTRSNLINWIDPKIKSQEKYIVIENGINLDTITNALPYSRKELIREIDEDTKIVCMVGRFSQAKDQPTLIKAIKKLPDNIHLLLVGEGELLKYNLDLAKQLDIQNRVHFLGFRKDIPSILKTVDVLVLSSYWEGLSLASIEALASGKPLVASKVNGLEEVVKGAGLLFERGNTDQLASLIESLLNDEQLYHQVKTRCIERSKKYSIQKMLIKLTDVYSGTGLSTKGTRNC